MKCPSCGSGTLQDAYLEAQFPCKTCNHCGGNWILLEHYLRWKDTFAGKHEDVDEHIDIEPAETKRTLICPVSGKLMLKYRITKDSEHRLDLSPAVNGIWLDKDEWAFLKQSGLAGKLNTIFTDSWQRKIRAETSKETFEQLYRRKFGDEDYDRIKAARHWINAHPHRDALLAFLIADDPWSASK